jgi:hypothetical protein
VEIRHATVSQAYENAALFQRVYPYLRYGFERLRVGDAPLWNPNQACGVPFLGDPSTGLFQPLNALFLRLPAERAMAVHAYACLSLMGFFFVLFMRALGVRYVPALFGGVAYAFCGASAAAISLPALAGTLAWAPFFFWGLRLYAARWSLRAAVLAGLGGALLVLSGSPALVFAALCAWVPYGIWLTLAYRASPGPSISRRVAGFALIGMVAISVSAVQWLPTIAWLVALGRPAEALWRMDLAGLSAPDWRRMLVQLLTTKSDALPHIGYVGIVTLLALPAAAFHKKARLDAAFFLPMGVLFLFLAGLGDRQFPFSFPRAAFAVPGVFCLAVSAGLGIDRLTVPVKESRTPGVARPALAALLLAAVVFYASSADVRGRIIIFCLVLAPFLFLRTRFLAATCGLTLALFLFVDLSLASVNRYHHPLMDAPQCYQTYEKEIGAAQEQALGGRVLISSHPLDAALPSNLGMIFPVAVANGDQVSLSAAQAQWWARLTSGGDKSDSTADVGGKGPVPEAVATKLIDFMSVRAILAAPDGLLYGARWTEQGERFREIKVQGDARLIANLNALPRAYFVPAWRNADSVEATLDMLCAPDFDSTGTCVVLSGSDGFGPLAALLPETRPEEAAEAKSETSAAGCTLDAASPESLTIRVETPVPGVTVLTDSFAGGWHATMDGIAWPILQVNAMFRGFATPAGAHEIGLRYRPLPYAIGRAVSLCTLTILALAGMAGLARVR